MSFFNSLGNFFSGIAKPFTSILGGIAPAAGGLLGSMFGGPAGGLIGSNIGNTLGGMISPAAQGAQGAMNQMMPNQMQQGSFGQMPMNFGKYMGGQMQNQINRFAPSGYQNTKFGDMGEHFGQQYGQGLGNRFQNAMPSFLQGTFGGMANDAGNFLGQQAGNLMQQGINRFMPRQYQNSTFGNIGNLMGKQAGTVGQSMFGGMIPRDMRGMQMNNLLPEMNQYGSQRFGNYAGNRLSQMGPQGFDPNEMQGLAGMGYAHGGPVHHRSLRDLTDMMGALEELGHRGGHEMNEMPAY